MRIAGLLFLTLFIGVLASAQVRTKAPIDSLRSVQLRTPVLRTGPSIVKTDIVPEITRKLDSLLARYTSFPNNQNTWNRVKTEAEDILLTYWRKGKLQGVNATEAFFVKMDSTTMTATDLASHRMVLIAGVAPVKPAEFEVLRIEKINK